MNKPTVAYLGLGIMGGAMAANLASKGYSVFAWNRTAGRPGVKVAESAGANISNSAAEAVQSADVVFLCLSDVSDIEQMLLGADSVTKSAKKGTLFIDMSTTGPECAQRLLVQLSLPAGNDGLPGAELAAGKFQQAAQLDSEGGSEQGTQAMIRAYRHEV